MTYTIDNSPRTKEDVLKIVADYLDRENNSARPPIDNFIATGIDRACYVSRITKEQNYYLIFAEDGSCYKLRPETFDKLFLDILNCRGNIRSGSTTIGFGYKIITCTNVRVELIIHKSVLIEYICSISDE